VIIAEKLGEMSENLSFKDLSIDAIHAAKQRLLDTIGCIIGGYNGESSKIVRNLIISLEEKGKSSILLEGVKTSARNATLVNGVMARILDFNDVYCGLTATHPNEPVIPAALAVGEEREVSGKELITAIILGYEFDMRLADIVPEIGNRGFSETATMGQYITPIVASRLMGLNGKQIANAIGICGCHNVALGGVWYGEVSMTKQIMNAFPAQSGVFAAQLAEKGFTGPRKIIEGEKGFCQVIVGTCEISKLIEELDENYKISDSWIKAYPCCLRSHSAIDAILSLVNENNLIPKDVWEVVVRTYRIAAEEVSGPAKIAPSTISQAQFSMHYCLANAIKERKVTTDQFSHDKLRNQETLKLASKVRVKIDPEMDKIYPERWPAIVEISTADGRKLKKQVDFQKGHNRNPLTDEEIKEKFRSLVLDTLSEEKTEDIITFIYSLEKRNNVSQLMEIVKG